MSDNRPDELAALADADFDLPLTEDLVSRVRRGVRRRRAARAAAVTTGAFAAVGAVVLAVNLVTGPGPSATLPPAASASASERVAGLPLDGFRFGFLPEGLRADPRDSVASVAVAENRLRDDIAAPGPSDPTAGVTTRRYERADGGSALWLTVLRPQRATPTAGAQLITEWLAGSRTAGRKPIETFDVPVGRAELVAHVGTETTNHDVVITTDDGAVISVMGDERVPVETLKQVALGIARG
ncbi:hypothetical protein ACQPYA_14830 [Micromonospora sp. CA-263727]|uniref:hypothetical protein n=1 Tax=Micromonospora sp. CA-263727 TaxID=3239967 RepID=UPI003D93453E